MVSSIASNSDRPQSARIWNAQKEVFEDQNYSYDAAGNLTSISASSNAGSYVLSLNWNSQGQLVSVSNSNPALSLYGSAGITSGIATASYYYDGFGNRVKKVTKDANGSLILSTGFLYSDSDPVRLPYNQDAVENEKTHKYTPVGPKSTPTWFYPKNYANEKNLKF